MKVKTIIFVDYGQDYLEWDIDHLGKVIDCRPFQSSFWCGSQLKNHQHIQAGDFAEISRTDPISGALLEKFIVYPIEAIYHHSEATNGA